MDTKIYYRQLKVLTIVAVIFSLAWLFWTDGRAIVTYTLDGFAIQENIATLQITLLIGYLVLPIALIGLILKFLFSQLQSLKNGIIFEANGYKYIMAWACIWPFYDICSSNESLIWAEYLAEGTQRQFVIEETCLSIALMVYAFGVLYKLATRIAEENRLTI